MDKVFLSLGSNIGNRNKYLEMALISLQEIKDIDIVNQSSIYETEPFGFTEQAKFLNMVIEVSTSLQPKDLLSYINKVEAKYERIRSIRWGPRTIDIDILLYGDVIMDEEILKIPHPFLKQRLFALIPLSEIYKGKIPGEVNSINELIELKKQNIKDIKLYKQV